MLVEVRGTVEEAKGTVMVVMVGIPLNTKLPVEHIFIQYVRHSSMVSNVEKLRTCEEPLVVEVCQWWFDVEWMYTRQSY